MRKHPLPWLVVGSTVLLVLGLVALRLATGEPSYGVLVGLLTGACAGVIAAALWLDREESRALTDAVGVRFERPGARGRGRDPVLVVLSLSLAALIASSAYALVRGEHAIVLGLGSLVLVVLLGLLARRLLPSAP